MKKNALLFVTLFLVFSRPGWGDESPQADNFSDYINSSESSSGSSVDKSIKPMPVANGEARKNSGRADTKPLLQGVPAQWKVCAVDSDCTAGVVDCVSWDALNKKYLHKLSKNLNSCSASVDPGFQPETICAAKACQTTEKTTDVSWEEWLDAMHKERSN